MGQVVISVEHLWKQYRLGTAGTGSLGEDLKSLWYRVQGKEDPTISDGEENDRTKIGETNLVWALRDLNFQINKGEVVGIIGQNGAGKSTLLKILSRVTAPTKGEVKIKGRIASLLEVGTGFHPDLTGRENIFMNGAILGMRKAEIKSKLDEIIAFSGVQRYVDTPVKRYSSGMYVRLAFAVAAHLEPEILIIDEVLAVGDIEFQKKCLGKMKDVAEQGRTVLFVSHNMPSVRNLCSRGILLKNGTCVFDGEINETVDQYLRMGDTTSETSGEVTWIGDSRPGGKEVRLESVRLLDESGALASTFLTSKAITIEVVYEILEQISGARMVLQLKDDSGTILFSSTNHSEDGDRKSPGRYTTSCVIPANLLNKGRHHVSLHMGIPGVNVLVPGRPVIWFNTILMGNQGSAFAENWPGTVAPKLEWSTQRI